MRRDIFGESGFLEFDRVVSGQAAEHAQELTELRTRLDEMESKVRGMGEISATSEHFEDAPARRQEAYEVRAGHERVLLHWRSWPRIRCFVRSDGK